MRGLSVVEEMQAEGRRGTGVRHGDISDEMASYFTKSEQLREFERDIASKAVMHFKRDFTTMTILCYLTSNVDHYKLGPAKRGQILWSCIMCQVFMMLMLLLMLWAVLINENGEYPNEQAHSFMLFLVKIPTMMALHFLLSPEVENGMRIMKFANQ